MVTAAWTSARFPHRENDDGSFDSICPACFRTVTRTQFEAELAEAEREHICDPANLAEIEKASAEIEKAARPPN